ncbi:MAG: hypothetical protein F4X72_14570 [Dehalococcoidia bacterium]|nr:hypothetical protein [Dehalococcoidia bacterium]
MAALAHRLEPAVWVDRDVLPYAARVSVWGRWFVALVAVFLVAYRLDFWYPHHLAPAVLVIPLVAVNGLVHWGILLKRPVTRRWLLLLSGLDVALISASVSSFAGLERFVFVAYYPSLAMFVLVFTSIRLGLAWTTLTAAAYTIATLMSAGGLDLAEGDEKVLLARLAAMYALVLCVMLITRFERAGRRAAIDRERRLQVERIELSQEIHDTTAQSAYLVGMGIDRARSLADGSNAELAAALDAASTLSRSVMWELRRPIDAGRLFEGRDLIPALWSHCETFESITGIPAGMEQSGTEPPLPVETRARLFSIAHNALTNAFRHARPSKVEVRLDFEAGRIRLSVSDDGVGLPEDYRERGRGFRGMTADAEALGGALIVESGEGGRGTTVSCVVPHEASERRGG